jgi:hypothetical protein
MRAQENVYAALTAFLVPFTPSLALLLPILKRFVPHVEHVPLVAGFPFFSVVCVASFISRLALHFTQ